MPFYQRLGEVPRKRHIQFRENGTLLTEEVMGLEGFTGNESILYHLQSPCRVMELAGFEPIEREEWVPGQHAHRHFKTFDTEPGGDEIIGRRLLMAGGEREHRRNRRVAKQLRKFRRTRPASLCRSAGQHRREVVSSVVHRGEQRGAGVVRE